MDSFVELCRSYSEVLRIRKTPGTASRAAAFLFKSGFQKLIYRRRGKIGLRVHEWLEIPDLDIAVLDFSVQPAAILKDYGDYVPDPYKRYKGVWNPLLQAFDWHLAPDTDLIYNPHP